MFSVCIKKTILCVRNRSRDFCTSQIKRSTLPQLSPYDVTCILRENEYTQTFTGGAIKYYDSNQLASNSPIEDSRSEGSFIHKNGFICGIFDGHGGPSCSQVISKRLLRYIAASLVDRNILKETMSQGGHSKSFLQCHNDKVDFVKEVKTLYEQSFRKYATELCDSRFSAERHEAIMNAFLRLDEDLSIEALESPSVRTMSVAMSGAVACVAVVEGRDLHVASTGDCSAVLGTYSDTGQWVSKRLTQEHNTDNVREIRRILSEHPPNERETVIRNERLLGQLAPLRALGDFRYKWSNEIMQKVVVPQFGELSVPQHYYTPPYLTACPEVTYHVLHPSDQFLVIGSDGLWDFLSPSQVVELVGEHMMGKAYLQPLKLSEDEVTLGQVSDILAKRKAGRKRKPLDQNSATHLIRNSLGGTEYGIEHSKLSHMLSLPQDIVRLYRDDITITVLYFDSEYLRNFT